MALMSSLFVVNQRNTATRRLPLRIVAESASLLLSNRPFCRLLPINRRGDVLLLATVSIPALLLLTLSPALPALSEPSSYITVVVLPPKLAVTVICR